MSHLRPGTAKAGSSGVNCDDVAMVISKLSPHYSCHHGELTGKGNDYHDGHLRASPSKSIQRSKQIYLWLEQLRKDWRMETKQGVHIVFTNLLRSRGGLDRNCTAEAGKMRYKIVEPVPSIAMVFECVQSHPCLRKATVMTSFQLPVLWLRGHDVLPGGVSQHVL